MVRMFKEVKVMVNLPQKIKTTIIGTGIVHFIGVHGGMINALTVI
jgi:hypothetical protein